MYVLSGGSVCVSVCVRGHARAMSVCVHAKGLNL